MKKFSKILLLPLFSIAMMKNEEASNSVTKSVESLVVPRCISYDLLDVVSDFIGIEKVKPFLLLMFLTSGNFFCTHTNLEIKMWKADLVSSEMQMILKILSKTLGMLSKRDLFPSYIPIPHILPVSIKDKFQKFFAANSIYSTFYFSKKAKIVFSSKIPEDADHSWSLKPKYVKRFLKFRQLAKREPNEPYFMVEDSYSSDFKSHRFEITKMHIMLVVYNKRDLMESPFYPASLSIHAIESFNIHDAKLLNLQFTGWSNDTIESYFLEACSGLTSLDLSAFSHITKIGSNFLAKCSGLTSIDLNPLNQATKIGNNFLSQCTGLKDVDLSLFNKFWRVGDGFLSGCSGLTNINLNSLRDLTQIDKHFLAGCSGLTSIDLSPLNQVTEIESGFLNGCSGLIDVDLSPLSRNTRIGDDFLADCTGLTYIDLNPLSSVEYGSGLLFRCSGLTSVDLRPFEKHTEIKDNFLAGCTGLIELDLSPLGELSKIRNGFLTGCNKLTKLNLRLRKPENVTKIEKPFLRGCTSLKKENIDIEALPWDHPLVRAINGIYAQGLNTDLTKND